MQVDGHIHIGEASRWAGRACSRLTGNTILRLATGIFAGVAAVVPGMVAAWYVTDVLGASGWLYLPVMLLVMWPCLMLALRLVRGQLVGRYRRRLVERGVVDPLPLRITAGTDGLTTLTGVVETRTPWSAVTEIFPVGPYWVLLIQGSPIFVPKRHFSAPAEERGFVGTVVERLSAEARGRSGAAVKFAADPA